MALKPELKSWLDQVAPSLSENVRTILTTELEKEDVAKVWKDTVMARSDYSRSQDELRREKEAAEAAKKQSEAWYETLTNWRNTEEKKVAEAIEAKKLADAELASHRARIQALAEQGLIDPNDPSLKVATNPPANMDQKTQNILTQEAIEALLAKKEAAMGSSFADAFTFFEDLADEHFSLTGQRLKRTELLAELKKNPNMTLQQVWEQKYEIPKIRAELVEKSYKEREAKAVAEAIAKDRSERATDVHAFRPRDMESDGENQHILSLFNTNSSNVANQQSEAVRAAKASWERGEFRQQPLKQPSQA